MDPLPAGLCDRCAHQKRITSAKGSTFSLCNRAKDDPAFPKYPRLPVMTCRGFERLPDVDPNARP